MTRKPMLQCESLIQQSKLSHKFYRILSLIKTIIQQYYATLTHRVLYLNSCYGLIEYNHLVCGMCYKQELIVRQTTLSYQSTPVPQPLQQQQMKEVVSHPEHCVDSSASAILMMFCRIYTCKYRHTQIILQIQQLCYSTYFACGVVVILAAAASLDLNSCSCLLLITLSSSINFFNDTAGGDVPIIFLKKEMYQHDTLWELLTRGCHLEGIQLTDCQIIRTH